MGVSSLINRIGNWKEGWKKSWAGCGVGSVLGRDGLAESEIISSSTGPWRVCKFLWFSIAVVQTGKLRPSECRGPATYPSLLSPLEGQKGKRSRGWGSQENWMQGLGWCEACVQTIGQTRASFSPALGNDGLAEDGQRLALDPI